MFLEWGWSPYLNNQGGLVSNYTTLIEADGGFFSPNWKDKSYSAFLPAIEAYRKGKNGNYDGLLCKVVNFSWTFAQDGSYDINLSLLSLGDVIESLKMNIPPSYPMFNFVNKSYPLYKEDATTGGDLLPSPTDNVITSYLFLQKLYLDKSVNTESGKDATERTDVDGCSVYSTWSGGRIPLAGHFVTPPSNGILSLTSGTPDPLTLENINTGQGKQDVVYLNYNNGEDNIDVINDAGFYMRFGHLLDFLHNFAIPKIKGSLKPILNIDYDMWGNRGYSIPYQVSLDPRVCIINGGDKVNTKDFFPTLLGFKNPEKGYCWPMNIYVSHNQILQSLKANTDENGNVALFDFLQSICDALNVALGSVNNFEVVLDEESNTLKIIDGSYNPNPSDKSYILELYGYDKSTSNFVHNFELKTDITNDFATMASVGSTAGGYVKGTENTMFSKWNNGLVDRFKEKLVPGDEASREKPGEVAEPNKMYKEGFWTKVLSAFGYTLLDIESWNPFTTSGDTDGLSDDIIDQNVATVTEFYKYCQSEIQKQEERYGSPTNGFIPISLNITMEGLSGIKIYNAVNVNTGFLPRNYPEALKFIIKGVNHSLKDNKWTTTIETVVIAQNDTNG
jgi:hypothetical protein